MHGCVCPPVCMSVWVCVCAHVVLVCVCVMWIMLCACICVCAVCMSVCVLRLLCDVCVWYVCCVMCARVGARGMNLCVRRCVFLVSFLLLYACICLHAYSGIPQMFSHMETHPPLSLPDHQARESRSQPSPYTQNEDGYMKGRGPLRLVPG